MHKFARVLSCSLILSTTNCLADTNWTNIQGNAAHTGYIALQTNPANIHKIWQQTFKPEQTNTDNTNVQSKTYNCVGAIIVSETAYLTINAFSSGSTTDPSSEAWLIAVDLTSGKVIWKKFIGNNHVLAEPTYDDGRIYVTDYDNNNITYQMIAYLSDNGEEDYRTPILGDGRFGAVAANGNVYISAFNAYESVNGKTGKNNWTQALDADLQTVTIAAVSDQYIIRNGMHKIDVDYAFTGKSIFQITAEHGSYNNSVISFPVYDAQHNTVYQNFETDYSDDKPRATMAFDLSARKLLWTAVGSYSQPVVAGNEVYSMGKDVTSNNKRFELQARDAVTGIVTWRWPIKDTDEFYYGDKIVATNDVVFIPFEKSTVAVSRQTHAEVWSTNANGRLVVGNHQLLVISDGDENGVAVNCYQLD